MTTQLLRDVLAAHPFLAGMADRHLDALLPLAEPVEFQLDELICRIGDPSQRFYLLQSGLIALEVPSPVRTFRIQTLGEGEELGWSSLLSTGQMQFQARCVDPARALAFDGAKVRSLCEEDSAFGYALMCRILQTVAERLEMTRMQLIDVYRPVGAKPP